MNQRCAKWMKIRDFKKDNVYLVTVLFILALSFPVLAQTPSSQLAANDWDSFSGGAQAVCSDDDIDNDDDGLIELCFLEDLDAVRYVLDGSGYKASASTTKSTQGCPSGGCKGYELVRDLDFKGDASYRDIANKERWTTGTGWAPIGYYKDYDDDDSFRGTFEGNGYSICNLMINRSTTNYVGLFSVISTPTVIHRVGLLNAEVVGLNYVGTLVGAGHKRRGEGEPTDEYYKNSYRPAIANSYSTGKVHGYDYVGGLIGISNPVMIVNSYSIGSVIGRAHVSGLAGGHAGIMTNSYSIGSVIGTGQFGPNGYGIGGLVGSNNPGIISNSYSMGTLRGSTSLGCIPVNSMGGLVDNNREGSISNSYSVGTFDIVVVPPRERYYEHCQNIIQYPITGGLAAFNLFGGKITTSYWDVTTSQLRRSAGGAGETTEQLQSPTTASGLYRTWSEADWDFGTSKQYPVLKYAKGPDPSTPMCGITGTPICGTVIGGQRQGSTTTEMAATINIVNRNPSVSEGDLVTLSAEVQGSAKGIMEYRWTQASGPNVLSAEVLVTTKTLQFRVPQDLIVSNGSTTLTFLLSTAFSKGMNAQMTSVRVQKIDNGQIANLGAPTQQAGSNILVAPSVDLSTDADGAGRITAYQWQRRTSGSSWLSIRNATSASYTLALTTNRGASFRVQISYVDGQDFVAVVNSARLRPVRLPPEPQVIIERFTGEDWGKFPGGTKAVCDDADIDNDDDGLIEICMLEDLDAIRYAPDGSGYRSSTSIAVSTQGCASGGCIGYELVRDLDFKDGASYRDIANKERWTTGTGWTPIGIWGVGGIFRAKLEGNGHSISNLRINIQTLSDRNIGYHRNVGLFGYMSGTMSNISLLDVDISVKTSYMIGALAGYNKAGTIINSYSSGRVHGKIAVGGLVGSNYGKIINSYSTVSVSGATNVGGLVGLGVGYTISNSYSSGSVVGRWGAGGLVGYNLDLSGDERLVITNSYNVGPVSSANFAGGLIGHNSRASIAASYWDTEVSGLRTSAGGVGKTTQQLQSPTTASGIYSDWSNADWDFGTSKQYPALRYTRGPDLNNPMCGVAQAPACGTLIAGQRQRFTGKDWSEFSGGAQAVCDDADIDNDNDGLIELCTLEDLDAIRYVPDGSGYKASASASISTQGCARGGCIGYELVRDLDFKDDASYRDIANKERWTTGTGWTPIGIRGGGGIFRAKLEGNGHSISNLRINIQTPSDRNIGYHRNVGLFGYMSGTMSNISLLDVDISVKTSYMIGALAGYNKAGTIINSYSSGRVHGKTAVGGLVGSNYGKITNSYSTVSVSGTTNVGGLVGLGVGYTISNSYSSGSVVGSWRAGGLVGYNLDLSGDERLVITNSYSVGPVSSANFAGGLIGHNSRASITASYWDTEASGLRTSAGGVGKTTQQLQSPMTASGIYSDWSNADWDFGTNKQYPALRYTRGPDSDNPACGVAQAPACGTLIAGQRQRFTGEDWSEFPGGAQAVCDDADIDNDDDGLIEICHLEGLDAVRYALDGSGYKASASASISTWGCASGGCTGYELVRDLDFKLDDSYRNAATNKVQWTTTSTGGWLPIGKESNGFSGTFDGNGYILSNLVVDRISSRVGLFGELSTSGTIAGIGLLNIDVRGYSGRVGGLVGQNKGGTISNSYSSGSVSGRRYIGGLVGRNEEGTINNSYSTGEVSGNISVGGLVGVNGSESVISSSYSSGSVSGWQGVGGLVGWSEEGTITNSYSSGSVSGVSYVGGLVGYNTGSITASYWDIATSGLRGSAGGEGKTTVQLQSPTAATGIYSDWSNADWDFGTSKQYPALRYTRGPDLNNPACGVAGTPVCGTLIAGQRQRFTGEDWSKFPGGAQAVCDDADIDNDDDGLIEICYLEGLDAIRYVLDGSGYKASASASTSTRGCASDGCRGYELVRDLDFQDDASYRQTANKEKWTTGVGWTPITGPYPYSRFSGRFEGNGYTLSNLMINSLEINSGVGLFYAISSPAVINRVGLLNVEISGYSHVGSLVSINHGTITNSYSSGSVREKGTIGKRDSRIHLPSFVGGLVGWQANSSAIVANSYSSASVNGHSWVGGLVGGSQWYATIANSYSSGSVSGVSYVGGLVGRASASTIVNSYSSSSVSGDDHVGGLVGSNLNMFSEAEGRPLVKGVITNSYSIGSVKGDTKVGGLVGFNIGIITASYWNTETSGMDTSAGGVGKTTVQLQLPTAATGIYSDWSNADWDFGTSKQYPALKFAKGSDLNNPACGVAGTPVCGTLIAGQRPGSTASEVVSTIPAGRFVGKDWSKFPGGAQAVCDDADIDNDDDGLIEICYLEDLDAVRFSLTGGGLRRDARAPLVTTGCGRGLFCDGYELVRDLDFEDDDSYRDAAANKMQWTTGTGWLPIGSTFKRRFDGNGHSISNLLIKRPTAHRVGLFSALHYYAEVHNVGLLNVDISGRKHVGSLAGYSYYGTITDSYSSGVVVGALGTGGLIGANLSGTISNSHSSGVITSRGDVVGGLVGYNNGTIANSYSTGWVIGKNAIGGLVGWNNGDDDYLGPAKISNSYSSGLVSGYSCVGGLVGYNRAGTIVNAFSTMSVNGNDEVGGLTGSNSEGTIKNSYSIGTVHGSDKVGGLVGYDSTSTIVASYWDITASGMDTSAGGVGKTTAQLQSPTAATGIYSGWSNADWDFGTAKQYPALRYTRGSDLNNLMCGVADTPACGTLVAGQRHGSSTNEVIPTIRIVNSDPASQVQFTGADWSEFAGGAEAVCEDADIDNDDDGLIEICHLEGLDAVRYAPDGSGYKASASASITTQGCASGGCNGYELVRDLDFQDDASYRDIANKARWATGTGWTPIGGSGLNRFSGNFEGNGHSISHLRINISTLSRSSGGYHLDIGLFGYVLGTINGVGLLDVDIAVGTSYRVGALAGYNRGTITNSYSSGVVHGKFATGGLAGINYGTIAHSYSSGKVAGVRNVGGLVGWNWSGIINNSYSTGSVTGTGSRAGGLVGDNSNGIISNSYSSGSVDGGKRSGGLVGSSSGGTITASYWDITASGLLNSDGGVGKTTAQLQSLITAVGIYSAWSDADWDFGTSKQYPALKHAKGSDSDHPACGVIGASVCGTLLAGQRPQTTIVVEGETLVLDADNFFNINSTDARAFLSASSATRTAIVNNDISYHWAGEDYSSFYGKELSFRTYPTYVDNSSDTKVRRYTLEVFDWAYTTVTVTVLKVNNGDIRLGAPQSSGLVLTAPSVRLASDPDGAGSFASVRYQWQIKSAESDWTDPGNVRYQWQSDWTDLSFATRSSYTIPSNTASNKQFRVKVHYTDGQGFETAVFSIPVVLTW